MAQAQVLPDQFTIEGRLFLSGVALSGTVDIKLEVVDSSNATCVFYREVHSNIDVGSVPATQGIFALRLGGGTKLFGPSRLSSVFSNASLINGDSDGNNTNDCSITPAGGSQRLVRMHVSQDSGSTYSTLSPDTAVTTVPTSMVAETLQGRDLSGFILVDSTGGSHMNQTDIGMIFNSANYTKLTALLNGTSTQYMGGTPTAAVSLNNQRLVSVANPTAPQDAATKNYSDSFVGGKVADTSTVGAAAGEGFTLNWDQTAQKWVAGLPNDLTKLPLAGGTMTGAINMGSFNLNSTGHITMSPQRILTLGTLTTAQESALTGLSVGASWYNSTTQQHKIWDGTSAVVQASLNAAGRLPASTIPDTTVTAGSYGSALLVPSFTVGADGRITAAANIAISGASPTGAAGGDLSGTYPNPTIATGAVTDAKIGSMSVDKITSATGKYFTYKPDNNLCTTNQVLKFDGTNWVCGTDDNSFSGSTAGGDLVGTYPNPTLKAGAVTTAAIADGSITDVKIALVGVDKISNGAGKYLNYQPNGSECANGELIQWDAVNDRWVCASFSAVIGGTPLLQGGNSLGGPVVVGAADAQVVHFAVSGAAVATIDTSGNFGVGITAPTGTGRFVHVNSSTDAYSHYTNATTGTTATDGLFVGYNSVGATIKNLENTPLTMWTNSTEKMRLDPNGNIGLGITAPSMINSGRLIHLHGGSSEDSLIHFTNSTIGGGANAGAYVGYSQNGSGTGPGAILMSQGAAQIILGNGGLERMRVDSYGVGIGTTSSPADGSPIGKIKFSAPNGAENSSIISVARGPQGATSGGDLQFSTTPKNTNTPTIAMTIESSGTATFNKNVVQKTFANNTSAMDWDSGTVIYSTYNCGAVISMANLREGGSYTLIITDSGSTACTFATTTLVDGVSETVSYRFMPFNGARMAGTHTIYNLFRANSVVYVTWTTGL